VGYREFREYEAKLTVEAENSDQAWEIAHAMTDKDFSKLEFKCRDSEPSDYDVHEVRPVYETE
jgi:hypothetical protein